MAIIDSLDSLVDKRLDQLGSNFLLDLAEIFLEVVFNMLEDKVEGGVSVDNFSQSERLGHGAYSTMFGCLRPFRREISLIAVEGTPSTSFSSLIFLRATVYNEKVS